jgi:hypothetical protein
MQAREMISRNPDVGEAALGEAASQASVHCWR